MASRLILNPRRPHLLGMGLNLVLILLGALLAAMLVPPGAFLLS